jgi:hypothetical protein
MTRFGLAALKINKQNVLKMSESSAMKTSVKGEDVPDAVVVTKPTDIDPNDIIIFLFRPTSPLRDIWSYNNKYRGRAFQFPQFPHFSSLS